MNDTIQFFFDYPAAYVPAAFAMSAFAAITIAWSVERLAARLQKAK